MTRRGFEDGDLWRVTRPGAELHINVHLSKGRTAERNFHCKSAKCCSVSAVATVAGRMGFLW
jgi:hypothetical protein